MNNLKVGRRPGEPSFKIFFHTHFFFGLLSSPLN
jgi:hypothetical protein